MVEPAVGTVMPDNCCVACILVTATGRVLVQWELDATLPFHYSQLALLVASLVQFSKSQEFAQLELKNGFTLIVRSDAISQLSCVVVCKTSLGSDSKTLRKSLDTAHLKSLVILQEFLSCYRSQVDEIVVESKANVASMAEKYTLTSALGEQDGVFIGDDGADCTMDAFVHFQNKFIAPMIEDNSTENIRGGISDSVVKANASPVEITRQFLMNADTGSTMYSLMGAPKLHLRHWYLEESLPTQKLLARAARALSVCFPILQRTSLFQRSTKDSCVGFSNAGRVSTTTVVLQVGGEATRHSTAAERVYIAVQMLRVRFLQALSLSRRLLTVPAGDTNRSERLPPSCSSTGRTTISWATPASSFALVIYNACSSRTLAAASCSRSCRKARSDHTFRST